MFTDASLTCARCRSLLTPDNSEVVGWCNSCINSHPITIRLMWWGRSNGASSEEIFDLVKRKFQSIWN